MTKSPSELLRELDIETTKLLVQIVKELQKVPAESINPELLRAVKEYAQDIHEIPWTGTINYFKS